MNGVRSLDLDHEPVSPRPEAADEAQSFNESFTQGLTCRAGPRREIDLPTSLRLRLTIAIERQALLK